MSRTVLKIPFSDYQQANLAIRNVLSSHGFVERFHEGSVYWQKGMGFFSAPKCIKFEFSETEITISAWISNFGVESALSGFVGIVPKRQLLEIIQLIKMNVEQG